MAEILNLIDNKITCDKHGKGHEGWIACQHVFNKESEAFKKVSIAGGQIWCRKCDDLPKEAYDDTDNWHVMCSECVKEFATEFIDNFKLDPALLSGPDNLTPKSE